MDETIEDRLARIEAKLAGIESGQHPGRPKIDLDIVRIGHLERELASSNEALARANQKIAALEALFARHTHSFEGVHLGAAWNLNVLKAAMETPPLGVPRYLVHVLDNTNLPPHPPTRRTSTPHAE